MDINTAPGRYGKDRGILWRAKAFISKRPPYLLILPAVVLILSFKAYPILNVFRLSFIKYNLLKQDEIGYAGLENFKNVLFHDELFWLTLRTTFPWTALTVFIQFFLGLLLALMLNRDFRGRGIYRVIVFSPWAVAGVLTSLIWSILFNGNMGVINDLLIKTGMVQENIAWLSGKNSAFWATAIAAIWRGIPFFAISLLASLQSIPGEVYESAYIDGAGPLQSFYHVTLPLIKLTIVLTTTLRFIWTFNYVDIIYSMTQGGPNNATLTLPIYIVRKSVEFMDFGYGSALAVCLFIILNIFTIAYMKISRFDREVED